MTIYIGTLKFDPSLDNGKNLVSFVFYYVLGDTLHFYESKWKKIPRKYLALLFICINVFLVAFFTLYGKNRIASILFSRLFFDYTSVGLLINSVVFFMLIGGMGFRSKLVNRIGKSSLAIYMIHGAPIVIYRFLPPIVMYLYSLVNTNIVLVMLVLMLITGFIILICWLIFEVLGPMWKLIDKLGESVQTIFNNRIKL